MLRFRSRRHRVFLLSLAVMLAVVISLNWRMPTLGGAQLWTDHFHRGGDRIQQHVWTGHWRLLDDRNFRCGWGNRDEMMRLLELRSPRVLQRPGRMTVLIHGLGRTNRCMKPLQDRLIVAGHPNVIRFGYASTRQPIVDSAIALRSVLEDYPAGTRFRFVGHSMGNIVVRKMIGQMQMDGDPADCLQRIDGMVMLGPPNQSSSIARQLGKTGVFGRVFGRGAMELGSHWQEGAKVLPIPTFPFAIFAGDAPFSAYNPLIEGPGDGVVTVEETRLEGATEYATFPVIHSFLMTDPAILDRLVVFFDRN